MGARVAKGQLVKGGVADRCLTLLAQHPEGLHASVIAAEIKANELRVSDQMSHMRRLGKAAYIPDGIKGAERRVRWCLPQHIGTCEAKVLADRGPLRKPSKPKVQNTFSRGEVIIPPTVKVTVCPGFVAPSFRPEKPIEPLFSVLKIGQYPDLPKPGPQLREIKYVAKPREPEIVEEDDGVEIPWTKREWRSTGKMVSSVFDLGAE